MREMRHYLAPDASYDTLSGLYMVRGERDLRVYLCAVANTNLPQELFVR